MLESELLCKRGFSSSSRAIENDGLTGSKCCSSVALYVVWNQHLLGSIITTSDDCPFQSL